MRTYLLPCDGQFYKANMHSHSTLSDGAFTPEELKKLYRDKGYAVFAYSEHATYHDLRHLDETDFITLPSYEIDFRRKDADGSFAPPGDRTVTSAREVIHMNLFATDPDKAATVSKEGLLELEWLDTLNGAIKRAKELGFIVSLNHPHWSINPPETYLNLPDIDCLEIINGAAYRSSGLDFVPHVHRDLASHGKRVTIIGGDDNHQQRHLFWAWTMFKAPSLTHENIINALKEGHCYASTGPEIKELYVEDSAVHIKTSPASAIHLNVRTRRKAVVLMDEENDIPVTEAVFPLQKSDEYFHLIVKDLRGKPAATQIYYLADYDWDIQ